MASKTRSTENPRASKSREATVASKANDYARTGTRPSFGAPVSAKQVAFTDKALKTLRKNKSLPQFLHFKSGDAAKRALAPVAKGDKPASSLPAEYKAAIGKLDLKLTAMHNAEGTKLKMWPRKYAIILHALLSEAPARKPRPKAEPKPEPQPEQAAA